MGNYSVKLQDQEISSKYNYLIRKTIISSGNKKTPLLGKSYPYTDFNNTKHINEVYVKTSTSKLKDINNNKDLEEQWKTELNDKIRKNPNTFNLPLVKIPYDNLLKRNLNMVLETLVDEIYLNPNIDIIIPPIIEFPDNDSNSMNQLKIYENMINGLYNVTESTVKNNKIAFFLPHYLPRSRIADLLDFYVKQFGSDSLIVIDINGLFEKAAPTVFFIMRKLNLLKEESFGLYAFNQRSNKKSGISVPSQDFLAYSNGISYIGPSHIQSKQPKGVLQSQKSEYKIFNGDDLLYYPLASGYPSDSFNNWIGNKQASYWNVKRYNSKNIETKTNNLLSFSNTDDFFNSINRDTFLNSLNQISKKRNKSLKLGSLNDFIK